MFDDIKNVKIFVNGEATYFNFADNVYLKNEILRKNSSIIFY
jgi:hypothetical protein